MRLILFAAIALGGCQAELAAEPSRAAPEAEAAIPAKRAVEPQPLRSSRYSTLSESACTLVEENRDEAGYWLRRCEGVGGYGIEWSESDLRQGLAIIDGPREERLEIARLVTNGAFNAVGERVEWRGKPGERPDRLIARVNVAGPDNPQGPDISKLVVVRLAPKACIVAIVEPGPSQNAEARAIADSGRSDCLGS